jgi:hypothetical protein
MNIINFLVENLAIINALFSSSIGWFLSEGINNALKQLLH